MKKEWFWIFLLSICIIVILPISVLRWNNAGDSGDFQIRVLMPDGKIQEMELEDYLIGVVAAEMPAGFENEALKAQAITARTFAVKKLKTMTLPDQGYDVDTTVKTQAWISDEEMQKKWGWLGYWRYKSKLEKAVSSTRGHVITSDNELIDAFFHSSSGRKPTERSEEVWSSARPYLKNVESEEDNPLRFVKQISFTGQDLAQKLNLPKVSNNLSANDIKIVSQTAAGRAKTISVFGKVFKATDFRTLLGLSSTDIEIKINPDQVTFITYGNGHAVGMSQYGANDMAKKGNDYKQIIEHYFPGSSIATVNSSN